MYISVTHYQNKTLYNKVFFGTNLYVDGYSHIQNHPKHSNANQVVYYDTKHKTIHYFMIFSGCQI